MPGAGTDKTKRWIERPAPIVVLVEPQLGENIGAAARAMANFGLSRLRLVKPLQGWPNEKARAMAAGADRVLDAVALYDTLSEAIADCTFVLATTARNHDQAKPVIGPAQAAEDIAPRVAAGENAAIVFGRERNGLENHEVALADAIVTLPINPAFASLNLAQAVVIIAYEWFKHSGGELPFAMPEKSPPAAKQQLDAFFADLERELEKVEFFRPEEKRGTMSVNLRNIFQRMRHRRRTSARCTVSSPRSFMAARARRAAACSIPARRRRCATFWPGRALARAPRCAASPNSCAVIRPRRSEFYGGRSPMTGALPGWASSGRCRSARTSPISCRFRSNASSSWCRRGKAKPPRARAPNGANICSSAAIACVT